jgi:metal-responsive CopG/Arc/MetJ family transcriptional regulator
MRVKTSITLPEELLKDIDRAESNRSAFFERAACAYLAGLNKARPDAKDLAIINSNADRLNAEALDVLDYQFCGDGRRTISRQEARVQRP